MDVLEFRPQPDQYARTFGVVAPTHRITPGTVKPWAENAFEVQRSSLGLELRIAPADLVVDGAFTRGVQP